MSTSTYPGVTGVTIDDFKAIFREHPAGVAIVTADAGDGPIALLASSLASLSAEPPLLVFSVSDRASSAPALDRASTVVVHFFGAENLDLVKLAAQSGSDRFADRSRWNTLPTGEPLFNDTRSWLRGELVDQLRTASATLHVVRVIESSRSDESAPHRPIVYHDRTWHELGTHSRASENKKGTAS